MNRREQIAKALYEAPDPDETESSTPWPPSHPEDLAWWLSRADAALAAFEEAKPVKSGTWRCGDCGREVPNSEDFCNRPFDDYLALRGGSIESSIERAVDDAIAPLVALAYLRLTFRFQKYNYRTDWYAA